MGKQGKRCLGKKENGIIPLKTEGGNTSVFYLLCAHKNPSICKGTTEDTEPLAKTKKKKTTRGYWIFSRG